MKQPPQLHPPLQGIWKALRTPGHHRFAYDFAAADGNGKLFSVSPAKLMLTGSPVDVSRSWRRSVHAPSDGKVAWASDGWPDRRTINLPRNLLAVFAMGLFQGEKAREDLRTFAGNFVVVESCGYHILLAHLCRDSVAVQTGEEVTQGQELGAVGNSGNSAAPHLHLQVNDGPDFFTSDVCEFVFSRYDRWTGTCWEPLSNVTPTKGCLFRFDD